MYPIILSLLLFVLTGLFSNSVAVFLDPLSRQTGCLSNRVKCPSTHLCIQIPGGPDICYRGRTLGDRCSPLEEDWASPCLPPLKCINHRCVCAPRNRQCPGRIASKGHSCSGPDVVCDRGLSCHEGRCKRLNAPEGEFCSPDSSNVCKTALKCMGPTRLQRCVKLVPQGKPCGFPYWNCEQGLQCIAHQCRSSKLTRGSTCIRSEDCAGTFACVADETGDVGICTQELSEGRFCVDSDGFRKNIGACGAGLTCQRSSSSVTGGLCTRRS